MGKPNFSEDFKRDAVHQITVRGYAVREVSERLGVSTYSLYKWMKLYAKAGSQTSSVDHEAENRRLKRELARLAGIRAEIGYKRKPGKYGGRPSVVVDNTLDRQFDVTAPDTAWVSDITYIKTYEGFLYLAVIIDLYSRRVIGWATQSRQPTDLVLQALLMAVWRRKPKRRVLIHTDQGLTNIGASMRSLRASSTCSNGNASGVEHIRPASRPDRTSSTTSKCSITRNANMSETVCCRLSTSKTDSST